MSWNFAFGGGTLHVGYSRLYPASLTFTAALTKRGKGRETEDITLQQQPRLNGVCMTPLPARWPRRGMAAYTVEMCRQDRSRVGVGCLFDECQFAVDV